MCVMYVVSVIVWIMYCIGNVCCVLCVGGVGACFVVMKMIIVLAGGMCVEECCVFCV